MRRAAAAIIGTLVLALMVSQPVSAKPVVVTGNLENPTSVVVVAPWNAGGNTFLVKQNEWDWTGDLTGHSIAEVSLIVHRTGMIGVHEYGTIYDAVWGELTGTITIVTVGSGDGVDFWLTTHVVSGTGDFEGLDAHGTIHLQYDAEMVPHVDYAIWLNMEG